MPSFGLLVLTKICSVKTALHLTARDFGDSFVPCDAGRLAPVKEQGAKIAQKNRREAARAWLPYAYSGTAVESPTAGELCPPELPLLPEEELLLFSPPGSGVKVNFISSDELTS